MTDPTEIMRRAVRDAVRAEARQMNATAHTPEAACDRLADAALAAIAPFMDALRAGSSVGYNRAAAKGAAPVRTESAALLSPLTTADEAGIPERDR